MHRTCSSPWPPIRWRCTGRGSPRNGRCTAPTHRRRRPSHHERHLLGAGIDYFEELGYRDRKRIHNLKYFTWVEQQGKTVEELDAQWYDEDYWTRHFHAWEAWDRQIEEFNERTGLLEKYR